MKARLCESVCWLVFAGIMAVGFGDSAFGDEARLVDLASWTKSPGKSDANGFIVTAQGTAATLNGSGEWSETSRGPD